MGNGKFMKCKKCGHTWPVLEGVGFEGKKPVKQSEKQCPKCGSKEVEKTEVHILWD